jgi:hypothetical protein
MYQSNLTEGEREMNTVFYILIILGASGKGSIGTANYDNLAACMSAKEQIESRREFPLYRAICTPSFVKKAKDK